MPSPPPKVTAFGIKASGSFSFPSASRFSKLQNLTASSSSSWAELWLRVLSLAGAAGRCLRHQALRGRQPASRCHSALLSAICQGTTLSHLAHWTQFCLPTGLLEEASGIPGVQGYNSFPRYHLRAAMLGGSVSESPWQGAQHSTRADLVGACHLGVAGVGNAPCLGGCIASLSLSFPVPRQHLLSRVVVIH